MLSGGADEEPQTLFYSRLLFCDCKAAGRELAVTVAARILTGSPLAQSAAAATKNAVKVFLQRTQLNDCNGQRRLIRLGEP
jgi:hypothetical protein